jgi:hypothetical protein
MKNVIALAAVAGLVGGAVGSYALTALFAPASSAPQTSTPQALTPVQAGGSGALEGEVAALRKENNDLALRLAALESRASRTAEQVDSGDAAGDLAALEAQIRELAQAMENPQSAQASGFRNLVASTLEEVRAQEEEERRAEREQRDVDRIVERMDEYAQELGLDAVQKKSMQDVLIAESGRRGELFTSMRDGNIPRDEVRDAFGALREETQAKLSNILTGPQLEQYNEMGGDRFGGRGGFGGPGAGGGGGGGGRGNRGNRDA